MVRLKPETTKKADLKVGLYRAFTTRHKVVQITLNGEPFQLDHAMSVIALLEKLDIDPRRVAVEHTLTIVKRLRFPEVIVGDGDQVEIVNFVGGG